MCPACVASVAMTAAGATSSGGVVAFALNRLLKKQTNQIRGKQNETKRDGTRNGSERNESPQNRVTAGVGGCAPATTREREGVDPCTSRAARQASADAVAGRGDAVRIRRALGQGQPA